ncbi:MAG TPA: glycosyltransferase family 39 protein [Candidatus Limnocylindrales bacterium]|nr:glycosyltransferase family 39 protein [Candidatus Limnocylindrales bacterium]
MGNILFLSVILLSSFLSIFLYSQNPTRSLPSLMLWLISIVYSLGFILHNEKLPSFLPQKFHLKKLLRKHWDFLSILLLGILVRFASLSTIPILTHDEAKDTGFFPQKILTGELADFFGYYAGINNFFFALSTIPHLLFSNPVLKVRFFSAFFGVCSIILIYFLAKKLFDKKTGLVAMLLLATYHVHIHFSRTEFLNLFDSFYALVILLVFSVYIQRRSIYSIILLAITLGFGLHFYSGLRAIVLLTTIIFIMSQRSQTNRLRSIITFLSFFLIAIGPELVVFKTRPTEAFAAGTAQVTSAGNEFLHLITNYAHSLLAYIYEPINFHYHYGGPFLVLPFSLLFLIGLYFVIRNIKNANFLLLIAAILGIPFFNSALLTEINYTHRLMSVVPIIILLTASGITKAAQLIQKTLGKQIAKGFVVMICVGFAIYNLQLYFVQNIWEKTLYINEFRAWEAQKIINAPVDRPTITFFLGNTVWPAINSVHPLPYLTQKHQIIDITSAEQLKELLTRNASESYILIVLPQNFTNLSSESILNDYSTQYLMSSEKVFYKNMELFDKVILKTK